jgi:hypothetical protein
MTHFNVGGNKRKADDAGVGDREGLLKRPKVSNDDMDQIEDLVANAVQQLYGENPENVQGLSPGFGGLSQEDFEFLIWRTSLTSSLTQTQSFSGSQESSLPGSPTSFEFGLTEHEEESPEVQEVGDSGRASQEDEDAVMSSQPAEEDNYANTPTQTGEQSLSDVEFTIDQAYIKETATQSVGDVWEELLLAVVDISDISQFRGNPEVQKIYSNYLQDVEAYISSLLNEGSEDDTWKPYT